MVKENIITEYELEQLYNNMLDDVYGLVEIAGHDYLTSRVLKETDPIAYHVGMNDYADSLIKDGEIDEVEGWS
tara:strand:- start:317 stop:535 length:219 start_codon:yes stop_codon:yes gene_type:complete